MMSLNLTVDALSEANPLTDLNKYEKGVTARAFLELLADHALLINQPIDELPDEILIPLKKWQFDFPANFSATNKFSKKSAFCLPNKIDPIC